MGDNQSSLSQLLRVKAGVGLLTQQRLLRRVAYMLSFSGILVWLFWAPTHLMPANPISRHVVDFKGDLGRAQGRAREIFRDLVAMDHNLVYYGRVNELLSPEERQRRKEEERELWEREQEERFWV